MQLARPHIIALLALAAACSRQAIDGTPGPTDSGAIAAGTDGGQGENGLDAGADACPSSGCSTPVTQNINCAGPSGMCTQAQNLQYADCILSRCDTSYRACFGPAFQTGVFAGPCASYIGCIARCHCLDNACRSTCGYAPAECHMCLAKQLEPCLANSGCTVPVCAGADAG